MKLIRKKAVLINYGLRTDTLLISYNLYQEEFKWEFKKNF